MEPKTTVRRSESASPWGNAPQDAGAVGTRWADGVSAEEHRGRSVLAASFMTQVFAWMSAGLAASGAVAWWVMSSPEVTARVAAWFLPLLIGEFVMVIALSAGLRKMSAGLAATMFLTYAALNGLTMGLVVSMYTGASVARVFFITAGSYGAMAAWGATTRRELTAMGSFLMMGVFAIVIAMVVNRFLVSNALDWTIAVLGVLIFAGLTAFDVQRFKALGYTGFSDKREAGQFAIRGALNLYLDFVNMFLFLLRLFGDRR